MMARMLLGYDNYADAAGVVLSGGVWAIPLSNLIDPRPSKKARTVGLSTDNAMFRLDLGAVRSLRFLALTHTNLTAAGQYRLTWFSDAFGAPAGTSGWQTVPGYPADDPDRLGASIFHIFPAEVAARWWQVEFADPTNPAGYIEVGRLFAPVTWEPAYNFSPQNNADMLEPNTPRQNALGGAGYFNRRTPARSLRFAFEALPDSETPTIRRIRRVCNLNKQVIVIPDPDDVANYAERNFLGTLKALPDIALFNFEMASTGFEIGEVVA